MTTALLIALLILLYSLQSLFCKFFSERYPGDATDSSTVYTVFYGLIVALLTFAVNGFSFHAGWLTVVLALLNAVMLVTYNMSLIGASARGSYSIVMICMLFGGILVPLAESTLIFDTKLNPWQFSAIGLMLVSFVFLNWDGIKGNGKRPPKLFYIFCLLLFFSNGIYGALLDIPQKLQNGEKNELVILTFLFAGILSAVILAVQKKRRFVACMKQTKWSALFLVSCCLIATFAVNLYVYCLSLIDVSILSALDNGGVLLLSVLFSCFFFHEKIKPAKAVGILLSLGSIVILNIF